MSGVLRHSGIYESISEFVSLACEVAYGILYVPVLFFSARRPDYGYVCTEDHFDKRFALVG